MKKRITALLLSVVLCLSLAVTASALTYGTDDDGNGRFNSDNKTDMTPAPTEEPSEEPSVEPTPGPVESKTPSFNDNSSDYPSYNVNNGTGSSDFGSWSSDKSTAKKGETVTITVSPKRGYEVDTVTVRDANGNIIAVVSLGGNKFSFVMPNGAVTVSVTFKAASNASPFKDVKPSDWWYDAVLWAYANDVTTGTGDGTTFSPTSGCTRAQFVTFLWRAAGRTTPTSTANKFSDVSETKHAAYYEAILWASEMGITTGTGDGTTFEPGKVVTRAQAVTFMYRYAQKAGIATKTGTPSFDDVANTGSMVPYYDAIGWAVANSITNGNSSSRNTFGPSDPCQRAMMVTFLWRLFA